MSDFDLDIISSGLDMVMPIESAQKQVFERVDGAVSAAKEFGNMQPIWNAVTGISKFTQATGLGLAKLFYEGKHVWEDLHLGTDEEYFEEAYVQAGKHKQTVKRYTSIWAMFAENQVPKRYVNDIMSLGVKALAPIAQLAKEGHEVTGDKWSAFAHAADEAEVRRIKKEITGKKDNPNALKIFIDSDGDITAITGAGKLVFIGYIRVKDQDPDIQRVVERIKNSSGMIEK